MTKTTDVIYRVQEAEIQAGKEAVLGLIEQLSLRVQEVQSEHPDQAANAVAPLAAFQRHLPAS